MTPPDAATVERFTRDWYAATGARCADRALVALSGGPDSSALLMLMAGLRGSVNPTAAATIDHRLRTASSAEAGRAADLARALGIPHAILTGELPPRVDRTANLSARARALRYRLLEEEADRVGARWIVTAHHADDQLETMVMRLNRGSGVAGLAGVRAVSGRIVRPLLGWRRAELTAVVAAAGWTAVNDPSNHDTRYDRARLRQLLAGADWLDPLAAARSAAALAEAEEALAWATDRAWERHCHLHGAAVTFAAPLTLPAEVRRRLTDRCLRFVNPEATPRGGEITRLMAELTGPMSASLADVVVLPLATEEDGRIAHGWLFRRAPPRRAS